MYLIREKSGTAPSRPDPPAGRPSAALLLTEPFRGLADHAALVLATPFLAVAPRGDGHGVLVLPGLLASDSSTIPLRAFLRHLGYDVRGWDLGRNHGPTEVILAGLPQALLDHAERTGRPVSVIGWSLGGVYARELARQYPKQVRQVITLGSPFTMTDTRQTHAHGPFRRLRHLHADAGAMPTVAQRARRSACRRRRCTPAWTASWPGRHAWSRRPRCTRTSRSGAATSASAWTRRRCG
jgi:pimeloyl-ACP methyl ester carboxylesterase